MDCSNKKLVDKITYESFNYQADALNTGASVLLWLDFLQSKAKVLQM